MCHSTNMKINVNVILGTRCFKPLDCNFNQKEHIDARSFGIALIMQTDNKNINHSEQYLTISYWDFGLSMLANPPGNYFLKFPGFKAESRAHAALVY